MPSPRETPNSNSFQPNEPWYARKTAPNTSSQVKYDTVDDQYADVSRTPTTTTTGATVIMDVPVVPRRMRVLLENFVISVAATDFGGTKLVDLPDRNIAIEQAEIVGTALVGGDYANADTFGLGLGTAVASNATLSTTMQDAIAVSTLTVVATTTPIAVAVSRLGATAALSPLLVGDAAGTALYVNVGNASDELASVGTVTLNGYVDIWYHDLGNVGS